MATITGLTAERMLEIEGATVIGGEIRGGHLILHKHDGTEVDAGPMPPGPQGPVGPAGGLIPGEVRIWPGESLPLVADFGKWAWADGAVYPVATYPKAAANISPQWRTFGGASDPGAGNFRVPDIRGLTPAGMDQMPGGTRANRLTRSVSIILAGRTGEEVHVITVPELAAHGHPVTDPGHTHIVGPGLWGTGGENWGTVSGIGGYVYGQVGTQNGKTNISIANAGSNAGHETMQPTVFVPYIVKMDD